MENDSVLNCTGIYYDERFIQLIITSTVSAIVSVLTCLCAISVIVLFKKWQSFGQRLLLYLIAAVAIYSLMQTLRRVDDFDRNFTATEQRLCAFSAYAAETTAWLEINAIVAVTFYLMVGIIWNKHTEKYEVLYFLLIFALPFLFTWIPFVKGNYGLSGPWCWITLVDESTCERILLGQVLQVVMYYGPEFLLLPAIILAYLAILCALRRRRNPGNWSATRHRADTNTYNILKSETKHLLVYPILYFFLVIPFVVLRVQSWVQPGNLVLPLWYVSVITGNLHGAAISLAFLLERDTRRRLTWTHLRAAVRNYNSTMGVRKFTLREGEEEEREEDEEGQKHKKVVYRQLTDESQVEAIIS